MSSTHVTEPLAIAGRLQAWLAAGATSPLPPGLLHPEATLAMLGRAATGAAQVESALRDNPATPAYAHLDWRTPCWVEGAVRMTAHRRAGRHERGVVLTVRIEDNQIAQVSQQRLAAAPVPAAALLLPPALCDRIDGALAAGKPLLMAYVDTQGQPQLSFRGSVRVMAADQLGLWVREAEGGFVRALARNDRVSFMYRDNVAKATYQLQGRAHVALDADMRARVYDGAPQVERDHDFARLGVAVLVDLDSVTGYAGLGPSGQIDRIRLERAC